jgi:hypothetical protein
MASAATLTPDQLLHIEFFVPQQAWQPRAPDYLTLNLGLTFIDQPFAVRSARLCNGPAVLGTALETLFGDYVGPLNLDPAISWKTADSLYGPDFASPAVIDFGPILDQTIRGCIDFGILTGAMTIDLSRVQVRLARALSSNFGEVPEPSPVVTRVEIVPEPDLPLAGWAAICLLIRRQR